MTQEKHNGDHSRTTLDRKVLPIPEPEHPPITEIDARKVAPPPRFEAKAPPGAPNVMVILLDNLGFGGSKPFGGAIEMPTLERLAEEGLIYNNFRLTPACSPSRVALLTGRNSHSANMGALSEMATPFPSVTSVLPRSVAPLAKILKLNGYSTAMFGKSHEYASWETGITGPFDQWPTGLGFERFYGNVIGESDQFYPVVHDNTTPVTRRRTRTTTTKPTSRKGHDQLDHRLNPGLVVVQAGAKRKVGSGAAALDEFRAAFIPELIEGFEAIGRETGRDDQRPTDIRACSPSRISAVLGPIHFSGPNRDWNATV